MTDSQKSMAYEIKTLREENAMLRAKLADLKSADELTCDSNILINDENTRLKSELAALKAAPYLSPEFKEQCKAAARSIIANRETGIDPYRDAATAFVRTVEYWTEPAKEDEMPRCPDCGSTTKYWRADKEVIMVGCNQRGCSVQGPARKTEAEAIAAFRKMTGDDAEFAKVVRILHRAVNGGCTWQNGIALVEAENALKAVALAKAGKQ